MKQWIFAFIVFYSFAAQSFAQSQSDSITTALAEARALINEGNAKAAIAKLQSLPDPKEIRVAHLLGVAYYHANDLARAIETLAPIVDQLPPDSSQRREAVQSLGLARYLAGHIADAIPFLEQTRAWAPNNNELTYALGMAYIQTRQPAKARESFARMFRLALESAAAHLVTAQMMIRLEFEEFAEAELKQAIEKDPKLPQAHYLLGQMAIFRARYDEGIQLLEREIALNPGAAMAYYKLGDAFTRQLKWDEAIAPLQKSIWLNPYYSGPYILLGKTYLKKKNLSTAEGMLKRAIQFDPNNKSAHYLLGQVYQQTGRAEEAKREFAIAEKLQGNLEKIEQ
ncbi:MAG: tetratricopeptide repeat protein [Acidobacteria bacterium]|nr:tetratricopeptide repeat protein [Acidobacteriota bacterium]